MSNSKTQPKNRPLKNRPLPAPSDKVRFDTQSSILRLSDSCGDDQRRLLLVHGYLNNDHARADYKPMIDEVRGSGWHGEIHGVVWDGGDSLSKIQTIAKKVAWSLIPVPGPHSVLVPLRLGLAAYQIRNYWTDACSRADVTGQALGTHLVTQQKHDSCTRPWTIAAHSLGCRVVFEAMVKASSISTTSVFENVFLFGGALATTCNWPKAQQSVEKNIVNCFSDRDRVLRFFFQLAQWQNPIGLNSIPSDHPKLCNHNCSEVVADHFSYHHALTDILACGVDE